MMGIRINELSYDNSYTYDENFWKKKYTYDKIFQMKKYTYDENYSLTTEYWRGPSKPPRGFHWSNSPLSLAKLTDGQGPKQSLQKMQSSSWMCTFPFSM